MLWYQPFKSNVLFRLAPTTSICISLSAVCPPQFTSTHLVSVAGVAAALLLTAYGYCLWEVELDVLLHWEGTVVVQARQVASLEVVQGQHVMEIYLVWTITDVHQGNKMRLSILYTFPFYIDFQKKSPQEGKKKKDWPACIRAGPICWGWIPCANIRWTILGCRWGDGRTTGMWDNNGTG